MSKEKDISLFNKILNNKINKNSFYERICFVLSVKIKNTPLWRMTEIVYNRCVR
jgi:hypothetical protein